MDNEGANRPAPFPPDFLERYEPQECFSHTEISETYLVKLRESGEPYVAKMYEKFFAKSGADERAILSELNHPAIPKLIDSFETEETVCIVLSYAHGTPLDKVNVPVGERFALNIGTQLCDILSYLHTRTPPIIHRDVKPQNVIIDEKHNITLIDFGIARRYNQKADKDTHLIASDGFSPPEQYGFGQTDNQADIYSLGRLLCWLLSGSNDIETTDKITNRELARVIRKCAELAPKDRYKTAEAVKAALIKACGKRNRRAFAVPAAGLLLFAFGFVLGRVTAPVVEIMPPAYDCETTTETANPIVAEGIVFKEPLIEKAVRITLDLGDEDEITEQDLYRVKVINIDSNRIFKNNEDYRINVHNPDYTISYPLPLITTLEDLTLMPYLEDVKIRAQRITNIEPLSELKLLGILDLTDNPISDFSPLKSLPRLNSLDITDTFINDLSPLYDLPKLNRLILNNCPDYDVEQLRSLKYCKDLNISGSIYSYQYLPDIQFNYLNLSDSAFDSLDWISSSKESMRYLDIYGTNIKSLDGIEAFSNLEVIKIHHCDIGDLEPLLSLPKLKEIEVSEDMREAVEAIADRSGFEIRYV